MKLFWRYCRHHRAAVLVWLLFIAVFAAVFALYGLPLQAVLYPAALCAGIGCIAIALDFANVCKKHRALERLRDLTAAVIGDLPTADSIAEEDYRQLIGALQSEVADLAASADTRYRDMVEYYTMWAHQIKTPIAAMRLTLQQEDSAFSRKLSSELFRIEQYVDMVLTFLRLDSPSGDYVFRTCRVDALVRAAVKKFASEFIDRKLKLVYKPIDATVVTDEKWFSFVLEQLLSNALKYTREGEIRFYLDEQNALCIEDTGIGIAASDLPRIFERGYTGYNGRSDRQASGIGLYLCKRICDNLGHDLSAHSAVGRGTTVRIGLSQYPLKKD